MLYLISLVIVSVAVALAGLVAVDCAVPELAVLDDTTAGFCDGLGALGAGDEPLISVGIAVVGLLAVVVLWRGAFKRWRQQRRVQSTGSLVSNIHRIVEAPPENGPIEDGSHEDTDIWKRVDELEERMRSAPSPGRDVASVWLALLRHANDLHSEGVLSTEDFKALNTRLLDLVSESSEWTRPATVG